MPQKQPPSFLETDLSNPNSLTFTPKSEADKVMDLMSPSANQNINPSFSRGMIAPLRRRHSENDIKYGGTVLEPPTPQSSELNRSVSEVQDLPIHQPDDEFLLLSAKDRARDYLRASRSLPASGFANLLSKDNDYVGSPTRTSQLHEGNDLSNKFSRDIAFGGFSEEFLTSKNPSDSSPPASPQHHPFQSEFKNFSFNETYPREVITKTLYLAGFRITYQYPSACSSPTPSFQDFGLSEGNRAFSAPPERISPIGNESPLDTRSSNRDNSSLYSTRR